MFALKNFFVVMDAASESADAGGGLKPDDLQSSTAPAETQTGAANISILANANEQPKDAPKNEEPKWQGDPRYFQTGKKAGQLRPSAAVSSADATGANASQFGGLNVGDLKASAKKKTVPTPAPEAAKSDPKQDRKIIEAKTGAKMVVRMLDMIVAYISRGQYGRDFTQEQIKERMTYKEALEKDWEDYLLTLDIQMHPGLVVAFGSATYVAAAFSTEAGQERAASWREKIGAKIGGWIFSRGSK